MYAIIISFIICLTVSVFGFLNLDYSVVDPDGFFYISCDGFFYYTYLPAIFIHNDIDLNFLTNIVSQEVLDSNCVYGYIKYGIGVAYLQSLFFFIAHFLTVLTKISEANGYTILYQVFMGVSALFYYLLGIILNYKILIKFFSKIVSQFVIVGITFGTGLLFYTTFEGTMPHVYSFFAISLFVYLIINKNLFKLNNKILQKIINSFMHGLSVGLVTSIKNFNILIIIVYLFYEVKNKKTFKIRLLRLLSPINVIFFILGFLIPLIPQFLYWHNRTGHYIINSYHPDNYIDNYIKNCESDYFIYLTNPKILGQLFSRECGLFVYYPVLLFALYGLFVAKKYIKNFLYGIILFFIVIIYLLSSFESWDGGFRFGMRFYIDYLVIFGMLIASGLQNLFDKNKLKISCAVIVIFAFCTILTMILQYLFLN